MLLGVCAACRGALGIEDPQPLGVCGPFGAPRPLVIDGNLTEPHDFSVAGELATVTARLDGSLPRTWVLEGSGDTWAVHSIEGRNKGLEQVVGAHAAPNGELYATFVENREVRGLTYVNGQWSVDVNLVTADANRHLSIGNAVDVPDLRRVVVVKTPVDGKPQLVVVDRVAGIWNEAPALTQSLNDQPAIYPTRGLLTGDLGALVYVAKKDGKSSDIFVSLADDEGGFGSGLPISSVNTSAEEDEAWISPDCSLLCFRRGDELFVANAD